MEVQSFNSEPLDYWWDPSPKKKKHFRYGVEIGHIHINGHGAYML